MAKKKEAKKEPKLVTLTFECPKVGEVVIEAKEIFWQHADQECELCGSHGHVKAEFRCECGGRHTVEIESW